MERWAKMDVRFRRKFVFGNGVTRVKGNLGNWPTASVSHRMFHQSEGRATWAVQRAIWALPTIAQVLKRSAFSLFLRFSFIGLESRCHNIKIRSMCELVYVKVMWHLNWPFLSLVVDKIRYRDEIFCFPSFSGQETQCKISQHCSLDAWPCTLRSYWAVLIYYKFHCPQLKLAEVNLEYNLYLLHDVSLT